MLQPEANQLLFNFFKFIKILIFNFKFKLLLMTMSVIVKLEVNDMS